MLDVHAPEHRIGGVRDFLLHLFTITCGLLIALGLENAAEAWHHRDQRREAEAMVRKELQENRDGALKAKPLVLRQREVLIAFLRFVEARSQGQQTPDYPTFPDFNETEIQDAAWRTASTTGALAYMEYGEVQKLSAAYKEQDLLQKQEQQTLTDYLQFMPFFAGPNALKDMDHEQAMAALPYIRRTLGDLTGVLAVGAGTLQAYDEALK